MYNSFRRPTSQPINIEQSSPSQYPHGHNDRLHRCDSDSSDEGRHRGHEIQDLSSSYAQLTVGSLPSSRRERRFMVSHGNNETLNHNHNSSMNIASSYSRSSAGRRNFGARSGGIGVDLSQSMPVPRAPFLASRRDRDSGERLSRIPSMKLPESVTDNSEASSVPYGSLNESQFRLGPKSVGSSVSSSFTSKGGTKNIEGGMLDVQRKVQEMRKTGALIRNDKGGLASLLGGAATSTTDQKLMAETQKPSNYESPNSAPTGGIGSMIEQSTFSQNIQKNQSVQSGLKISPSRLVNATNFEQSPSNVKDVNEQVLSTSVTGLSILEASPKGLIQLQPDEREAMASLRSRSHSGEGMFMRPKDTNISSESFSLRAIEGQYEQPTRRLSSGSDHSQLDTEEGGFFDLEM